MRAEHLADLPATVAEFAGHFEIAPAHQPDFVIRAVGEVQPLLRRSGESTITNDEPEDSVRGAMIFSLDELAALIEDLDAIAAAIGDVDHPVLRAVRPWTVENCSFGFSGSLAFFWVSSGGLP